MEDVAVENERHPFRFMIKFAIFVGILFVVARLLDEKRKEFANLTETEARDKFMSKASMKLGEDQAKEIADQVIPVLIEKGLIKPDPSAEAGDDTADAADEVAEAVDSVVNED